MNRKTAKDKQQKFLYKEWPFKHVGWLFALICTTIAISTATLSDDPRVASIGKISFIVAVGFTLASALFSIPWIGLFLRKRVKKKYYEELLEKLAKACRPIDSDTEIIGRDKVIDKLLRLVMGNESKTRKSFKKVIILTGPSGVGKSSLLTAKNGLLAKLVKSKWTLLDKSGQMELIFNQLDLPIEPADISNCHVLCDGSDPKRVLIVYDQSEQFIVPRVIPSNLTQYMNSPCSQTLFVIREESLSDLLLVLRNEYQQNINLSDMVIVQPLDSSTARGILRKEYLGNINDTDADTYSRDVVEQVKDQQNGVLPMNLIIQSTLFEWNKYGNISKEESYDKIFKALVLPQMNPILASHVLLLFSSVDKGRRPVTTVEVAQALAWYDKKSISKIIEYYKQKNIIQERKDNRLELICDVFATLINDRVDTVVPGLAVRNSLSIFRTLKSIDSEGRIKLHKLIGKQEGRKFSENFANISFMIMVLTILMRLFVPWHKLLWGTIDSVGRESQNTLLDINFIPAFFALLTGAIYVTRYQKVISCAFRHGKLLEIHHLIILTGIMGIIGTVLGTCSFAGWVISVGVVALYISFVNWKICSSSKIGSITMRPNYVGNMFLGITCILSGIFVIRTMSIQNTERFYFLVELYFAALISLNNVKETIFSFGEKGYTEIGSQSHRGLMNRIKTPQL